MFIVGDPSNLAGGWRLCREQSRVAMGFLHQPFHLHCGRAGDVVSSTFAQLHPRPIRQAEVAEAGLAWTSHLDRLVHFVFHGAHIRWDVLRMGFLQ